MKISKFNTRKAVWPEYATRLDIGFCNPMVESSTPLSRLCHSYRFDLDLSTLRT